MNNRPVGDDWAQPTTSHQHVGHDPRRCLDQHRAVTLQVRRSGSRSPGQRPMSQQTLLMRAAVVTALILVLGVAVAVIRNSEGGLAGAAARSDVASPTLMPPTSTPVPSSTETQPIATDPPTAEEPTTVVDPANPITPPGPGETSNGAADGTDTGDRLDADEGYGQQIDLGGVDQTDDGNVDAGQNAPTDLPPDDCGNPGVDGDGDGIPTRWDFNPCVADHVSAAAPCESYVGLPLEDPFGDWDWDGVSNQSDSEPCDPTMSDFAGDDPACTISEDGNGDADSDGIADRWDYDPCVPSHVSAASPCDSYHGDPSEDPDGDWDMDDSSNATDSAPCDPVVL